MWLRLSVLEDAEILGSKLNSSRICLVEGLSNLSDKNPEVVQRGG